MDCPECGSPLVTYRLEGREAPTCEQCGYVGIEAEHRGARARAESWSDALRRFYGTADDEDDDGVTVPIRSAERGRESRQARAETWAEAFRRFYDPSPGDDDHDHGESTDSRG
jgi:DNA-directed RNA polymerase subunit M/transcription elongation factor TFIIS